MQMLALTFVRPAELCYATWGEFDLEADEPQWVIPEQRGLTPGYSQKNFPINDRRNRLQLLASHDGRDGSIQIHQDVSLYATALDGGQSVAHELEPGRHAWLQVIRGSVDANGRALNAGDGASVSDESRLTVTAAEDSEFLLFDLA